MAFVYVLLEEFDGIIGEFGSLAEARAGTASRVAWSRDYGGDDPADPDCDGVPMFVGWYGTAHTAAGCRFYRIVRESRAGPRASEARPAISPRI